MFKKTFFSITVFSMFLVRVSLAASTLTVQPSGDGAFVLQGTVDGAASMDITMTYDTQSLANPRVEQGALVAGGLMAVNPNIPGAIRMGIIRTTPIQGSGTIATVTFDRKGEGAGRINTIAATLSSINGKAIPVAANVINPANNNNKDNKDTEAVASNQPKQDEKKNQPLPVDENVNNKDLTPVAVGPVLVAGAGSEKDKKEPEAEAEVSEKEVYANRGVLDGFREFKGERSMNDCLSLFELNDAVGFHQEPWVILADGKSSVKAVVISESNEKAAPGMTAKGARLISVNKDPDATNTWIAELVPEKKAVEAGLTVSMEKFSVTYPITVAPKVNIDLDKSGAVTEADFDLFLKKKGSQDKPSFDLNGDGRRDYIDDYIFTANYLVATGEIKMEAKQSVKAEEGK